MRVLVNALSGEVADHLLANVRDALPDAVVTLAVPCDSDAARSLDHSMVDAVIGAPSDLDGEFCSKFDLIVPGDGPDDWTDLDFLQHYSAAAYQDKLWMVPGGPRPRKGDATPHARQPDPTGGPIRRLTVVTASFNYGDYFSVSAHLNRPLVDRLIVATSLEDHDTIRAARREGCEAMIVATETPTRMPFAVVGHKNYFINRALRSVPHREWVLHVDSDIVLPPFFPDFLVERSFVPGHLYGSVARRLCDNEMDVLASYPDGPWLDRLEMCMGIIGYFGLFQRSTDEHPLPEGRPDRTDVLQQDDHIFLMSFPADKRVLTALQVLHLGSTGVNWGRRTSDEFQREALLRVSQREILEQDHDNLRSLIKFASSASRPVSVLRLPGSRRLASVIRDELGDFAEASTVTRGSMALAFWWEEADLRAILHWIRNLPPGLDELVVVGKGLDHVYHPKMAAAVRFLFGVPDVLLGEGWCKTLARADLERLGNLSKLLEPPQLADEETDPLFILAIPEDASPLSAIPWIESVAAGTEYPTALFSGDRAGDIEIRALELGVHLITGEYVKMQTKPPFERRSREAVAKLDAKNTLIVSGTPSGAFDPARAREWFLNGADRNRTYPAEDFSVPQDADFALESLIAMFQRLRIVEQCDTPVHVMTTPGPDLDAFFVRLATWPLPRSATVHLCGVTDQRIVHRRSKLFDFRLRIRPSRPERIQADLNRSHPGDLVLQLPSDFICRRTAFLPLNPETRWRRTVRETAGSESQQGVQLKNQPQRSSPEPRDLERWGWVKQP